MTPVALRGKELDHRSKSKMEKCDLYRMGDERGGDRKLEALTKMHLAFFAEKKLSKTCLSSSEANELFERGSIGDVNCSASKMHRLKTMEYVQQVAGVYTRK